MQFGIEFSEANRFMNDDPYPQCTLGSYFTEEEKCSNLVKKKIYQQAFSRTAIPLGHHGRQRSLLAPWTATRQG